MTMQRIYSRSRSGSGSEAATDKLRVTMSVYSILLLSMLLLLLLSLVGECHSQDEHCGGLRCGDDGPLIKFPFRLKDKEPQHCGYPGFDLSCTPNHDTLLEIFAVPDPIKFHVTSIEYLRNYLTVSDPGNCLPSQMLKLINTSISPFHFHTCTECQSVVSFFNCSRNAQYPSSCPINAAPDMDVLSDPGIVFFCTKMFDISYFGFAWGYQRYNELDLSWSKPDCQKCEEKGTLCRLKNNGTNAEGKVECVDGGQHKPVNITMLLGATGIIAGSILLVLVVAVVSFKICHYFRMKVEDRARIEKFLEDYRALKPTRFSYSDIKRITNGFKENLGEGAHGTVFKGMLSSEIIVAVKILNSTEGEAKDFINEVGTMGKIHHVNVVRLLGFCAQGFHRALVYEFFPKGSLQNFISTPDNKDIFLGWKNLHQIAVGVARGIEYLHIGCEQQILHFDINPHNVLLDDNFRPKITDFGLAKLCSRNQSAVSMTAARGTLGYIAPEVVSRNFGNVSHKSDIYSYGMLLLEMVGGRKNVEMAVERPFQVLYPEWVHNLIDGEDTHVLIEEQEDVKIAKKIAIVGVWCIQWHPSNRPSIKTVIRMLEDEEDKLMMPNSPFQSTSSTSAGTVTIQRPQNLELEIIPE